LIHKIIVSLSESRADLETGSAMTCTSVSEGSVALLSTKLDNAGDFIFSTSGVFYSRTPFVLGTLSAGPSLLIASRKAKAVALKADSAL